MLPGKKFGPEDVLQILRKRYWMLIVPFAVAGAVAAGVAHQLPDRYQSEAVIQIVPQRVPENYVKPTVTARIADRLQSIKERILSRTRLEQIIQQFNLYPEERRTEVMETVIEQMRRDTPINLKGTDSFTVGYIGPDALTVLRVTSQLAKLFMSESQIDRQELADGTDQFLEAQLEEARSRLVDQEKKLEAYKTKFSGQLPTQVTSNLQAVSNIQMQIQNLVQEDNRDTDRRAQVERDLKDLETGTLGLDLAPAGGSPGALTGGTPDAPPLSTTRLTLEAAKRQLALLKQTFADAWPDVQAQKRYVDDLQRKVDAEDLQRPLSVSTGLPAASLAELALRKKAQGLRDQLDQIDKQVELRRADRERLRAQAQILQQRVDAVPARESEMTELTRDYGTFSSIYTSLLAKKDESRIAANLLTQQIGEQFKLLDPARMPEKPFSPNRPLMIAIGLAGGLAMGLGLIVLKEYRNTSFATDGEVTELLALPVLAVVPIMQSQEDRHREKRRRMLMGLGLGSTVAGCLAVVVYAFLR